MLTQNAYLSKVVIFQSLSGVKAERVHWCRVANNTVRFHAAGDAL